MDPRNDFKTIKTFKFNISDEVYEILNPYYPWMKSFHEQDYFVYHLIKKFLGETVGSYLHKYSIISLQDLTEAKFHKLLLEEINFKYCKGTPDYLAINNERDSKVWIEVKMDNDIIRSSQIEWVKNHPNEKCFFLRVKAMPNSSNIAIKNFFHKP